MSALAKITETIECQFKALKMGVFDVLFAVALSEFHTYTHRSLAMKAVSNLGTP